MGGPNWTVYPGPKNQPYHNQPSGASLCSANRPWDGTAALLMATEIRGENSTLEEGGRHDQLVTRRFIPMGPPALTPLKNHNQPWFGSVGAELPRERRSGCDLWRAYFWYYGRRWDFKASLNCNRADEFDRSARSLAKKT